MTPTKLLLDARPIGHPTARQRGIGRYVTGLLRGLTEIGAPVIALCGTEAEAETLRESVPGVVLLPWSRDVVRRHTEHGAWYVATQLMLHPIPLDPVPRVITEARLPVAAVMYDVIPFRFPDRYHVDPDARHQAALRAPLTRTLDSLLAISEFAAVTAADELEFPIERIGMIGAGVEPQFVPASVNAAPRPDRVLPAEVDRYVVAVTGGDERKNTDGLIRAWGLLPRSIRDTHHLVIACAHSPAVLRDWEACAAAAGVAGRVIFTGAVDDDEMVAIHQWARLAVMPSFEEGFGLPVLEAAACAIPVINSELTSLPEVLAEPAACFDPGDDSAIARAVERALTDDGHRRMLLDAGRRATRRWTWQRVATDTMSTLAAHGPRWNRRLRRPATRIALAGPFSGSASGIGQYDELVLGALRRQVADAGGTDQVLALVDGSGSAEPAVGDAVDQRRPVRAMGRFMKPWDLDHVVAALGSSPNHVGTAALVDEAPCHVWLHEASLVGLYVGLAHASGSERWAQNYVRGIIARAESEAVAASVGDDELLDAERLHGLGVTLIGEVVDRARSVVVSSERAAAIVRSLRPDGPPLTVLPLAFPPIAAPAAIPSTREIVSAGWLAGNKAPELAVEVLARLDDDVSLAFVGGVHGDAVERVERAADRLGVRARVTFTGRLDAEAYAERLGRARVGLQLRESERGEMSAVVTELVARGIPTVTTMTTAGESSPGLRVVGADPAEIADAVRPSLVDDVAWAAASADALARAASWTVDDVAAALLSWLDEVERSERAGPTSSG